MDIFITNKDGTEQSFEGVRHLHILLKEDGRVYLAIEDAEYDVTDAADISMYATKGYY